MNIAVEMIGDVVDGNCNTSVLVSADCDLVLPIRMIKGKWPKYMVFAYFPPNKFSNDLQNEADAIKNLLSLLSLTTVLLNLLIHTPPLASPSKPFHHHPAAKPLP